MLDNLFRGLFDTQLTSVIPVSDFLLCVVSALAIGLILAGFYMYRPDTPKALQQPLRCFRRLFVWSS